MNLLSRSCAVKYGESQIAIFHVPHKGYFATQQVRVDFSHRGRAS